MSFKREVGPGVRWKQSLPCSEVNIPFGASFGRSRYLGKPTSKKGRYGRFLVACGCFIEREIIVGQVWDNTRAVVVRAQRFQARNPIVNGKNLARRQNLPVAWLALRLSPAETSAANVHQKGPRWGRASRRCRWPDCAGEAR